MAQVRAVWSAAPGIDLLNEPAVVVRAYLESFVLASKTGDINNTYPGFQQAVDTNAPALPFGRAAVRRAGADVTVVTYGSLVATALSAADLAEQHGWRLEVVDLRTLNPLDFDTVADSVRKTGRAVVMHEGPRTLGFGAELAARIQEELFYHLEAPVLRATGFDTPYPPARLEKLWLPGPDRLLDCVERAMGQP